MTAEEAEVYAIFQERFSKQEASSILTFLERSMERKFEDKKTGLATKEDINRLLMWTAGMMLGQIVALFAIIKMMLP